MRVLVTRPEREGRATAARLEALGHAAILEPVTTIVAVEKPLLPAVDGLQAVTATSLNAVEVLIGRDDLAALKALPFFAVGERTARAAREAGFGDVRSADGDRRDLVREIVAALDPAKGAILWLVGRDRAGDLVADLAPLGFRVETAEVYRAEPISGLSEPTRAALAAETIDAAMVFSPRSGKILLERLAECGFSPGSLGFAVHAISEATARPFREAGWREVFVASSPDSDAMFATLGAAPVSAAPGGEDIRSCTMPPKSDKGRSKTGVEAAVGDPTAPSMPATETAASVDTTAADEGIRAEATEPTETVAPSADAEAPVNAALDAPQAPAVAPEIPAEVPPAATPVREPAPAVPPAPQVTVVKRGGVGLALVAMLLGGVAGVAGSYGLALKGLMPGSGESARIAALEAALTDVKSQKPDTRTAEQVAALEKRVGEIAAATPATPSDVAGLEGRIAKLEMTPAPTADLSGVEGRLTRLEAAPKPSVDLSGLEGRIAKLEAAPPPSLPADLAERLAALEAAAKARIEAAQTSIAGALSSLPAEGPSKEALDRLTGKLDETIGSLKAATAAEIAALQARIDRLTALEGEDRATATRLAGDLKALGERLSNETQALGERLGAMTNTAAEDLRKRSDEFARVFSERVGAALATSDAEARRRGEELAKAVSERVGMLSSAVEAEFGKRSAEIGSAFEGVKQKLQSVDELRGGVEAALGRVTALETAQTKVGDTGRDLVEKVGEAAEAAQSKLGALENRLAGIEAGAEASRQVQSEAVVVMALATLKAAVDGGKPFAAELAAVEGAGRGGLDLAGLKPFADKGVPGAARLEETWRGLGRGVIAAADKPAGDGGVFDRLLANASGIVRVRPAGETAGTDVPAIVARLEARLAAGDLPGALEQWKTLPEASRAASAAWGAAIEARVGVDRVLATQTAAVAAKLTQQSQ